VDRLRCQNATCQADSGQADRAQVEDIARQAYAYADALLVESERGKIR
jgi:hypothetical protein